MKITFLIPPALDNKLPAERIFGCNYGIYFQPNIFILYPATILKQLGHGVKVKDCVAEKMRRDDFLKYIRQDDSGVYIFYTVFLSKNTDLMIRNLIREIRRQAIFIYIATEPSSHPDNFVDRDSYVIRGESEETIKELIDNLDKQGNLLNIKGISYMRNGKIQHNPPRKIIENLDNIPFPDRSLINAHCYYNPKLTRFPFTAMVTSRGCNYNCYFCVPNSLSFAREIEFKKYNNNRKPLVRLRSAKNVIDEFEMLYKMGYKSISILDDQFAWNKKRIKEICNSIKRLKLEWSCLCRADHLIDEDVVRLMKEAGCGYVDVGVESFVQEILDDIKKDMDVKDVYEAVRLLKKYNIEQELNILFGSSPLETEETIKYTLSEVKKLDVDYVLFSICTPFPCTEFNKIAKINHWMIEPEYRAVDPIKESFISYPHLPKKKLDSIIRQAYFDFYFNPHYIFKKIKKIRSFKDLYNKAKTAITILR